MHQEFVGNWTLALMQCSSLRLLNLNDGFVFATDTRLIECHSCSLFAMKRAISKWAPF